MFPLVAPLVTDPNLSPDETAQPSFLSDPNNAFNQLLQSLGYRAPDSKVVSTQQGAGGTWTDSPSQQGVSGAWDLPAVSTPTTTASPDSPATTALQEIMKENFQSGLAGSLQRTQDQTDQAMKDPAFRKAVGFQEPVDPLAADKNGWNLPKTGKVNTTGASQRINARTGETGVTATKDANGQTVLSNMDPAASSFDPAGQLGKNPLPMTSLLTQLRGVNTTAEASVIMDSIRSTVASENVRIQADALKFASGKMGIPAMEVALSQAELLDRGDKQWFPGIGDSHETQAIRKELGTARIGAKEQADDYLKTNLASGMLKVSLLGAQEELARINKNEARKEGIADRITLNSEAKKAAQQEEDAALVAQISPGDKSYLKILNPSLQNDDEHAMAKAVKLVAKDKPRMEAIKAASEESGNSLIALSVEKNADAKTLLIAQERLKNPSMDINDFEAKLQRVDANAEGKNANNNIIALKYPGKENSPEAKAELAKLNLARTSAGDATDKIASRRGRIEAAIAVERKNATGTFLENVNRWGSNDPGFMTAYNETLKARGKADFQTVMDTYVGASTGMEAQTKLSALSAITSEAFARQASSVFGKPEVSIAQKMITDRAKKSGIGQAILASLSNNLGRATSLIPFGDPLFNSEPSGFASSFTVQNDPVTGKPFPR